MAKLLCICHFLPRAVKEESVSFQPHEIIRNKELYWTVKWCHVVFCWSRNSQTLCPHCTFTVMVALFLIQTSNSSSNYTKLLILLWPLNSFHTQVIFLCIFLCPSASFAASFHHPSSYFLCPTVGHNALTSAVGDKGQGRLMGSSRDWSLHANPAAFTLARGKISVNWPKFPQAWTVETYLKTIKIFPMEGTTLQLDLVSSCYYYYYFSDNNTASIQETILRVLEWVMTVFVHVCSDAYVRLCFMRDVEK